MAKQRIKKVQVSAKLEEAFPRFVASAAARGVSDKTIQTYHEHIHCVGKHIDLSMTFLDLEREDLDEMIVSMRESGLSHNSIASYTRVFRTFLKWCREQGLTDLKLPNIKDRETVKETYTDDELRLLLQKPKKSCNFCEYRNWVIINFLLNSGCRASTVRNIRIKDLDFEASQVIFRHTKSGKIQVIPLCRIMVGILREYLIVRGGGPMDYLFPTEYGEMMSQHALSQAIAKYNLKRGVDKTSIHLFRHTFARKYLVDCGGDAFALQKLLGHSTLKMTRHYCSIFDADIARDYDRFAPLAQISAPKEKIIKKSKR